MKTYKIANCDVNLMKRTANEFLTISWNNKTFIPNFVNLAFACELYLKTILQVKTGQFPGTHNLEILYNKVTKNIDEKQLLEIFNAEIEKTFSGYGIMNSKRDLLEFLNENKNLYVDWRYYFDLPKEKIGHMNNIVDNFAVALKEYVNKFIIKEEAK